MTDIKRKLNIDIIANLVAHELKHSKALRFDPKNKVPILIDPYECKILDEIEACKILYGIGTKIAGQKYEELSKVEMLYLSMANAKATLKSLSIRPEMQVEAIAPFLFKSTPGLTYCRIPFDPLTTHTPTPTWDVLLGNFTNILAVKMWIGSLFIPHSNRVQYLWLFGKGGNGKSTLANIISECLGQFVRYEQAPSKDDKYWTHGLLGKRLIVLDDCNNYGFVKTGLFKALTGGSKVRVEQKFSDPFDTDLVCKFLFTSNELPMVSSDIADQRRIILSTAKTQRPIDFDPTFHSRLKDELPAFISNCLLLFAEHCKDGNAIPTDNTEALELGGLFDEEISAWVDSMFEYSENSYTPVSNFRLMIRAAQLDARRVYAFLERKNVSKVKTGHDKIWQLKGLKQRVFQIR